MPTVFRSPETALQFFNNAGQPNVGGTLLTQVGGVNTATYQDAAGTTALPNPIPLNSRGEISNASGASCELFLIQGNTYTFTLYDVNGNQIGVYPNITGINDLALTPASSIPYTPPGTGAVATSVAAALNAQVTSIYNWLSSAQITNAQNSTGSDDLTAAITAAHATKKLIYYPTGTYKVAGNSIPIPGGGMIGDGAYNTNILTSDNSSNDIFSYTGNTAPLVQGIQFIHVNTTKPGGFCFVVVGSNSGAGTGEVSAARFLHCEFNNYSYQLDFRRASLWSVIGCNFYNYSNTGVYVDNQNNGDSGDAAFHGCVFFAGNSTGYGIQQVSSGGIKVQGCKFNGGGVGYLLNLGNIVLGSGTADLMINGNSFENMTFSGIQMQRQGGATSTFGNVEITGNQIYVPTASQFGVSATDSSGFLSKVVATGNVVTVAGNGAGGFLFDYVNGLYVGDNLIVNSGGGTTSGIQTGAHCTNAKIGINQINGFTYSVNPGAGTTVIKADVQTGTVSQVCSSAYGALWSGTPGAITLSFDSAISYTAADVEVIITNATGGCGYIVNSISPTSLSISLLSATNGATVNATWIVRGVV